MKCKLETFPPYRIAYMRRVGPYGPANVEVMEELKKWARKNQLLDSAILFAIPQDNPQTTAPEHCRFDACIVLSENAQLNAADSAIREGELAGGNYLVFEVKHTAEDIQRAYTEIFPALHSNGYTMDDKPILEKYTGDLTTNPYCEICVPVKM
ncbi:AraC family transcriptional regulator [Brevibacillus agri]|uniref:AraC family transcriptional regulator n=1 Tax=Brevibacillus agri TaxID=51101 RepID=UPI0004701972|nr:GyrI-like domain-containing protein [Brevibacillus agri]MED4571657.1 GyrI-like domain-containing protein [Brevibacillus agri]WHX33291.1 GyrI-like domain-containing protein [Brevibacillus agri]